MEGVSSFLLVMGHLFSLLQSFFTISSYEASAELDDRILDTECFVV